MFKKVKTDNKGVSEVLDTVLLLGIAVSLFSVLSFIVLSFPIEPSAPSVNLVGYVDDNNVTIDHTGGEPLGLDTEIILRINQSDVYSFTVSDVLSSVASGNGFWNLGEKIVIDSTEPPVGKVITNSHIDVTVVDKLSNSVVLMGTLKEAS